MYREMELVVQFEHPSRTGFMALGMYPSLEPSGRQKIASSTGLNRTLEDGRLTAWGYRAKLARFYRYWLGFIDRVAIKIN